MVRELNPTYDAVLRIDEEEGYFHFIFPEEPDPQLLLLQELKKLEQKYGFEFGRAKGYLVTPVPYRLHINPNYHVADVLAWLLELLEEHGFKKVGVKTIKEARTDICLYDLGKDKEGELQ